MSSRRLPGKVLADIGGQPALGLLLSRLSRATELDEIIVATSTHVSDRPILEFCEERQFTCHRGPLNDVLERYREAATISAADVVVRVTADCPLIDPSIVDRLIRFAADHRLSYAGLSGEFPHGLDCEVFRRDALDFAARRATDVYEREHVTPFMKGRPQEFPSKPFDPISGMSFERWTLDYAEDLQFLRRVVDALGAAATTAGYADIAAVLDKQPEIRRLNENRVGPRS